MAKPQKTSQYKIRGLTAKERQKIHEPLGAEAADAFKYTYPIPDSAKLCEFYILPHCRRREIPYLGKNIADVMFNTFYANYYLYLISIQIFLNVTLVDSI